MVATLYLAALIGLLLLTGALALQFHRREARWRAEIGEELADAVRIQRRLFADPALADAVIRAAALDTRLCRLFALVALGEARLRGHRLEMAGRFLLARLRMRLRRRRGLRP